MRIAILALIFTSALCAQTETPAPIKDLPQYFAVVGGGLSPTANIKGAVNAGEGFVSMAVRLGADSSFYSISTVDINTAQNSARTGLARLMAQSGKMSLLARIDAGISTASPTISSFSAGAIVTYQFKPSWYFVGELRMTANPSGSAGTVQLGTYLGIGRSF